MPSDFHFDELKRLLQYHGFKEVKKGRTSGSRVRFLNEENVPINLHKPHPDGIMKRYQLKQIKVVLGL
jgi:HicA toxin of bacterial toxin-antitoxin,